MKDKTESVMPEKQREPKFCPECESSVPRVMFLGCRNEWHGDNRPKSESATPAQPVPPPNIIDIVEQYVLRGELEGLRGWIRAQRELASERASSPAVAGRTQGDELAGFKEWAKSTGDYTSLVNGELVETWVVDDYPIWQAALKWAALRESASPKREVRELCDIHRASVSSCHECQKVDGESAREVRSELVDNSLILKALATLQVISPVGSTDYEAAKSLLAKVSSLRSASPEAPAAAKEK